MTSELLRLAGRTVLLCAASGPAIGSEADAVELVGAGWEAKAAWLAIPASRFLPDFWRLSSTLAGGFIQKIVTYHLRLAILGPPPQEALASTSLAAFITESNRGDLVWFVDDLAALQEKLARP